MSIHEVRIAHWRTARDRNGRELDLHPWLPSGATALKTATIRHCAGCTACGEAVECDPPCDNPRWCGPERPCEGLRTAQEWARQHAGGTAAAIVTTSAPRSPEKAPALHRSHWTAEEDAWLVAHPGASSEEVAQTLGRTPVAVGNRRRALGITAPAAKPWSEYEDRLLRGCTGLRDALAMLPARTRSAVKARARSIGHKFRRAAA